MKDVIAILQKTALRTTAGDGIKKLKPNERLRGEKNAEGIHFSALEPEEVMLFAHVNDRML